MRHQLFCYGASFVLGAGVILCFAAASAPRISPLRYALAADRDYVYTLDTATGNLYVRDASKPFAGLADLGTPELPHFRVVSLPASVLLHKALLDNGVPLEKADRFVLPELVGDITVASVMSGGFADLTESPKLGNDEIRLCEWAQYLCLSEFAESLCGRLPKDLLIKNPEAAKIKEVLTDPKWRDHLPKRLGGSAEEKPYPKTNRTGESKPSQR